MSLVIELQAAALDGGASVDELLRKALIVSMKLDLGEFKEWVKLELNGYPRQKPTAISHYPGSSCVLESNQGVHPTSC